MDYTTILTELKDSSLFELYRLNNAIWNQLEDPARVRLIKNQLKVGQLISYFEVTENRFLEATIVELNRTRTLVKNEHDGKLWNIPYYFLNINNANTDVYAKAIQKTIKSDIKVGDNVYFKDHKGHELFGEVTKLNPKTAGVLVGNTKWKVGYSHLSTIIDGELGGNQKLLDVQVVVKE